MDTLTVSREEGLRRALMLAIPVGTQLGSVGLESLGRAADGTLRLATWSISSAVRTAGAGVGFVNRNVLSPLSSFAFGSNFVTSSNIHFCTQMCPQEFLHQKGRKHHPTRAEVRYHRAANNLRSGSAKCSIRRERSQLAPTASASSASAPSSTLGSQQSYLLAHLAASCALMPSYGMHDEHSLYGSSSDGAVAQWTVNTLGLQSSML